MTRSARTDRAVVSALVAVPFVVGAASAEAPEPVEEFTVTDHRIVESSGLTVQEVDGERLFTTVNDSGDTGRVFVVDPTTGDTVGTTTWTPDPADVEALAPAGAGEVWVGDIGDNLRRRDHVTVLRVPVGRGDRTVEPRAYDLAYPDRPRDAEALLAHPLTGQLFVVSKSVIGGFLYAAPPTLHPGRVHVLEERGVLPGIVTDGAFSPDGRHLVVRNYTDAWVFTFPALSVVAQWQLPKQPQGEGLAVSQDGEVFVSTEGRDRPVLRVELPPEAEVALTRERQAWWWTVLTRILTHLRGPGRG